MQLLLNHREREWDYYNDEPDIWVTHYVGLKIGTIFIGVTWITIEPEDKN